MRPNRVISLAVLLVVLITLTLFFTINNLSNQIQTRKFYVGVEFAYSDQFSQLKALVDKVKGYTNLLVIGDVFLSFNRTALDQSADYVYHSGLSFIVLFTSFPMYENVDGWSNNYFIFNWMQDARIKYGGKFLGIYRYDEVGGNQLDDGRYQLVNDTQATYSQVAQNYVDNLSGIIRYYSAHGNLRGIVTSDYGLYWFDYQSDYTTVFAEFVGNQTKQRIVALERGAAESFGKDWGVIVTYKYDQPPYLESGNDLYNDLKLTYDAGAKYAVVFSYSNPNITDYGILTEEHFAALKKFWNEIHTNPESSASIKVQAAYVIPADYGFGFRNPNDTIWGLFSGNLSSKIYEDTQTLVNRYNFSFNIIYDNSTLIGPTLSRYSKIYYWNQTVT